MDDVEDRVRDVDVEEGEGVEPLEEVEKLPEVVKGRESEKTCEEAKRCDYEPEYLNRKLNPSMIFRSSAPITSF